MQPVTAGLGNVDAYVKAPDFASNPVIYNVSGRIFYDLKNSGRIIRAFVSFWVNSSRNLEFPARDGLI